MINRRCCQLYPIVVPIADFRAPSGVGFRRGIDHIFEPFAQINAIVHCMQIYIGKHRFAAFRADGAVKIALRMPFQQHISNIKNNGLYGHKISSLCTSANVENWAAQPLGGHSPARARL